MTRVLILDPDIADPIIARRKRLGIDCCDEVWDGLYRIQSPSTNSHQALLGDLASVVGTVVDEQELGASYPGANVSDREKNWKRNYRCPDIVVVLNDSRAVDCGTHFWGGPDFIVEVESPDDDTEDKTPFYSAVGVRELLIVHRDRRTLRLLRHDGDELVETAVAAGRKPWLLSEVIPIALRQIVIKGAPRTEVRRTDGKEQRWTI